MASESHLLGKQCSCINYRAKQLLEWALDFHIVNITKEISQDAIALEQAKREYVEITGKEPGHYGLEERLERLRKELDVYADLREEIIKLPKCDEPAFEVQK